MIDPPNKTNNFYCDHVRLLLTSYKKFVGNDLLAAGQDLQASEEIARQLFEAPLVVLSHNTLEDPIFNYANRKAMELFEMDWPAITQMPSRKSAEPMNRAERDRLLTAVKKHNFIDDYSGVRVSATGRRFHIPQATVWNLVDEEGIYRGQAATFAEWKFL